MGKENNPVKEAVKAYLDERAKTDELFAKAYAKPNKSIDECYEYIVGEVYDSNKGCTSANVSREDVFGMAVHYYDEDDIKPKPLPRGAGVSHDRQPKPKHELTAEEKDAAQKEAIQEYKQSCIEKLKAADEAKKKRESEKKKAAREQANKQTLSLFDF